MNKYQLSQLILTEKELKNIDYALPQDYVNACNKEEVPDVRTYTVWSYVNSILGEPLNLAELYIKRKLSNSFNLTFASEEVEELYNELEHDAKQEDL